MEDEYTEVLEEKIKKIIKLNNCLEEEIYNCNRKLILKEKKIKKLKKRMRKYKK